MILNVFSLLCRQCRSTFMAYLFMYVVCVLSRRTFYRIPFDIIRSVLVVERVFYVKKKKKMNTKNIDRKCTYFVTGPSNLPG